MLMFIGDNYLADVHSGHDGAVFMRISNGFVPIGGAVEIGDMTYAYNTTGVGFIIAVPTDEAIVE